MTYGEDLSIRELAELVRNRVGFTGKLAFDPSRPDGTMRKLLDTGKLNTLGWQASTPLSEGVKLAYGDFVASLP